MGVSHHWRVTAIMANLQQPALLVKPCLFTCVRKDWSSEVPIQLVMPETFKSFETEDATSNHNKIKPISSLTSMHSAHHRHRMSQARLTLIMFKVHFRRNWSSNLGIKFLWSLVFNFERILKLLWNLSKRPSELPNPTFPTIFPPPFTTAPSWATCPGVPPSAPTPRKAPVLLRTAGGRRPSPRWGRTSAPWRWDHDGLFGGTKRGPGEMDLTKRPQRCWADNAMQRWENCLMFKYVDWLVVEPPLWKIWVRQLRLYNILNIWKNKTCSKPPTSLGMLNGHLRFLKDEKRSMHGRFSCISIHMDSGKHTVSMVFRRKNVTVEDML